jgi:hypothetical protein
MTLHRLVPIEQVGPPRGELEGLQKVDGNWHSSEYGEIFVPSRLAHYCRYCVYITLRYERCLLRRSQWRGWRL